MVRNRIKSFVEIYLECKGFFRFILIAHEHHYIIIIKKRIRMVIVFKDIGINVVFLFKAIGQDRFFTFLFVNYLITFDDIYLL